MNVDQLEEFEGLTPDLVRAYLERKGWKRDKGGDIQARGIGHQECWRLDEGSRGTVWIDMTLSVVERLCKWEDRTPQQVLREMNPRMRRDLPSVAAWEAHGGKDGFWIACWNVGRDITGDDFAWFSRRPFITQLRRYGEQWNWGIRGVGFTYGPEDKYGEVHWLFWPCDKHVNKCAWPKDANGKDL